MAVEHQRWQPKLRLETASGAVKMADSVLPQLPEDAGARSSLRPFHFSIPLDQSLPGRCYKLYDESNPGFRAPFCLPPLAGRLCRRLAPPNATSAAVPALWSVLQPFRSIGVPPSKWEAHLRATAARVNNYVNHVLGMGGQGVLLYADAMTRVALEHVSVLEPLTARGRLVWVSWPFPERSPLSYAYDMALVASHALLALGPCGTNLALLVGDVDEYLYNPFGRAWPELHSCLRETGGPDVSVNLLRRVDVASSVLSPSQEAAWWSFGARTMERHPIFAYNRLAKYPHRAELSKMVALPSQRVVSTFVHEGYPLHGRTMYANASCGFLLHVKNYWVPRVNASEEHYTPFRLHLPWGALTKQAGARASVQVRQPGADGAGAAGSSSTEPGASSGSTSASGGVEGAAEARDKGAGPGLGLGQEAMGQDGAMAVEGTTAEDEEAAGEFVQERTEAMDRRQRMAGKNVRTQGKARKQQRRWEEDDGVDSY
ncbi:hypothetical protein HYH03_012240 [Edaphochlamys debaryana]|uniref:Glycosyltransferase family 92 protein n=1 Tax=Edaphochlamys debaryana TaxID=47281 RepID=A0A835XVP6_9CHLO|nr:hypothetical protein HYH03_012240 [Edaphochlamys debaryana]|eukprot:KAG2489216.1 hypothetical protein HYH03_012240 [Edaphochlamys debaryana]